MTVMCVFFAVYTPQSITDSAVYVLSEVYKDRAAMGRSLVKIFIKLGKVSSMSVHLLFVVELPTRMAD